MTERTTFNAVLIIENADGAQLPVTTARVCELFEQLGIKCGVPWTSVTPFVLEFKLPR